MRWPAIADWVQNHAEERVEHLEPTRGRLPTESTLRRAWRLVDAQALEEHVARYIEQVSSAATVTAPSPAAHQAQLPAQAIDGKEVRGVGAHGQPLRLVGLVQHGTGAVRAQRAVEHKSHEVQAARELLADRDLTGTVTTMDALHTCRPTAEQVVTQHGHDRMVVQKNQRELYQAIDLVFEQPVWLPPEKATGDQSHRTCEKGHGRLETRTLEASPTLNDYLDFAGVGQVLRRQCLRITRPRLWLPCATDCSASCVPKAGITSLRPCATTVPQFTVP